MALATDADVKSCATAVYKGCRRAELCSRLDLHLQPVWQLAQVRAVLDQQTWGSFVHPPKTQDEPEVS